MPKISKLFAKDELGLFDLWEKRAWDRDNEANAIANNLKERWTGLLGPAGTSWDHMASRPAPTIRECMTKT